MKRIISVLLIAVSLFGILAVGASAAKYSDVQGHWGQSYVEHYTDTGVVKGYPDGTFKPDNKITRAEAAQVLLNYFKFTGKGKGFSDVKATDWYYDAVLASQQNGAFEGYEDGTFKPTANITRQEVIVMLRRITTAEEDMESGKHFIDYYDTGDWAKGSVGALRNVGVLDGYEEIPGTFYVRPTRLITRAEFVKLLFTIEKSDKVQWQVPGEPVTPDPTPSGPSGGNNTPPAQDTTYYNVAVSIKRASDGASVGPMDRYPSNAGAAGNDFVLLDVYSVLENGHHNDANNPKDEHGNTWNWKDAFQNTFSDYEAYEIISDMIRAYATAASPSQGTIEGTINGATPKTWSDYVGVVTVNTISGKDAATFKTDFLNNTASDYSSVGVGEWEISFETDGKYDQVKKTYTVTIKVTSYTIP